MAISFDLNSFQVDKFINRNSVDRLIYILKISIIALIILLFILLVNSIVSGLFSISSNISTLSKDIDAVTSAGTVSAVKTEKDKNYQLIVENKLFGELGGSRATTAQPTPAVKKTTPLNLELIGTFIATGQTPYAIIEDKRKRLQDVFNIRDSVFDEATLVAIYNDRVEVRRDGEIEVLRLDSTPDSSAVETKDGVAVIGENQFIVEEAELDKALENLPLLLTQARAVPYFKEGKAIGLRMFAIRNASIFEKIGLRNGDILKSINGNSLGDLSQAMKLFERLKEERSLSVMLERNNEEKEFTYQIR